MRQRGDNLLIRTHTCFRWHDGLFPAFNFEHMHALKPDGFLVVVDNLDTMYARLKREHEVDHNLIDLAFLREEEIFATQLLSEAVLGPGRCFIVARGRKRERLDNIARLIADPKAKRCYPSIPMTHAMGDPELWEKICVFRSRLAEKLVCFDPVDVDEKNIDYLARDAEKAGHSVIRVTVDDQPFEIPLPEAKAAVKYIDGQIRARDFALIDQAHFIASYIPELQNGLPGLSSGVERELEHARRTGKRMFIVWEPKKLPSPFDDSSPTVVVPNTEALFEALAKHGMIN